MQQLGASLIADDLQCLVELIKNAYDADAKLVRVVIEAPDQIVVEDNGHGMDRERIIRGWLTISNSLKAEQKRRGELTSVHGRTPLGDKGLGRLSTQRLGNALRIESVAQDSDTLLTVEIDWSSFVPGSDLTGIPVELTETTPAGRAQGTRVIVTNLVNPEEWSVLDPNKLRLSLASLVSPYAEIASFRLQAFLNGKEVTPDLITSNVRNAALQQFRFGFDGEVLHIEGLLRNNSFRGNTRGSQEDFQRYFEPDSGASFFKYLEANRRSKDHGLTKPTEGQASVFCSFSRNRTYADIVMENEAYHPGPFSGEIDAFSFDTQSADDLVDVTALSSSAEAKRLIREMSGIKVYRDGFITRTDHDWLKLGEGQTRAGSWYALRPFNTMGYVAISARDNASLQEKTDRQGFVEDQHYAHFLRVLEAVTKSANDILEFVRRGWNEFVKDCKTRDAGLDTRDPRRIEEELRGSFDKVGDAKQTLKDAAEALGAVAESDKDSLFPRSSQSASQLAEAKELISQATAALDDVSKSGGLSRILVAELDSLNERLGEVYELVSLGITAEALSHDISVILERLSLETRSIKKHSKESKFEDSKVLRYFEVVRSTVNALEKQLGHLDPAMRYAREKREVFAISRFLGDVAEYYHTRFETKGILLEIACEHDFEVNMNRGKLIQILDNLVLNSEYWLSRPLERSGDKSVVTITATKPRVIVEDSGRGVEPAFEETLFDPFVTAKPKGQGRGLGLFIASQLLELDGCSIELLPDRNRFGRRFRIGLNLSGAVSSG
jgi:signal transduction histidine kinase